MPLAEDALIFREPHKKADTTNRVHTSTCSFEAFLQNFNCHISGVMLQTVRQKEERCEMSYNCHISGVYAPTCKAERRQVQDELGTVRGLMEGPWAVCGDFNVCRFPTEKRSSQRRTSAMIELSDTIEDLELIDLLLEGGSYTWLRGDTNNAAFKDRQSFILYRVE